MSNLGTFTRNVCVKSHRRPGVMSREDYAAYGAITSCKRGNDLPQAKLTPEKVREIRARFRSHCRKNGAKALAAEFGVHPNTITNITSYAHWRQVK